MEGKVIDVIVNKIDDNKSAVVVVIGSADNTVYKEIFEANTSVASTLKQKWINRKVYLSIENKKLKNIIF